MKRLEQERIDYYNSEIRYDYMHWRLPNMRQLLLKIRDYILTRYAIT